MGLSRPTYLPFSSSDVKNCCVSKIIPQYSKGLFFVSLQLFTISIKDTSHINEMVSLLLLCTEELMAANTLLVLDHSLYSSACAISLLCCRVGFQNKENVLGEI